MSSEATPFDRALLVVLDYIVQARKGEYSPNDQDRIRGWILNFMGYQVQRKLRSSTSETSTIKECPPKTQDTYYTTNTMIQAVLAGDPQFEVLRQAVRDFAANVWEKGLADQVEKNPHRGMEGTFGSGSLLTFTHRAISNPTAGRVLLSFTSPKYSVTALALDKSRPSRMGLHGIESSIPRALELIRECSAAWQEGRLEMKTASHIHPTA